MPVLNPDHKMIDFLDSLLAAGFKDVIIVNDGSSSETVHFFEEADAHPEVTVLTHEVNKGKGAGLKTAFSYLGRERTDIDGAVTVDGDGQHDVKSINNCLAKFEECPNAVIIGGRDFDDPDVPPKSKVGNKISKVVYRFAVGIKLNDTQTGLRVIPAACFESFSELKGDRYEYETNMLIAIMNQHLEYYEVPIKTIYIDDNASSHFNAVKDSFRIYKLVLKYFFKFMLSSLTSWVVDIVVYYVAMLICSKYFEHTTSHIIATAASRIISSIVNFLINRKVVFKAADNVRSTAVRYYVLAFFQMCISFLLVDLFAGKILKVTGILDTIVKCVVDACLFVFSYGIQRKWVFKNKKG